MLLWVRAMDSDRARGLAWAFGSALASGAFVIPWKLASGFGAADAAVLLLLGVAAVINTALAPLIPRQRPLWSVHRAEIWLSLQLAILALVGNRASAAAIAALSPAMLSVLLRTEVLVVALLGWWLLGERVDRRFWLGTAIATPGLWWVRDPGHDVRLGLSGVGWALLAAASFGSMNVLTRKHIRAIEPGTVNALRLWFAVGLGLLIYGVPPALRAPDMHLLCYVFAAAVAGPGLSRLALMFAVRHVEARWSALVVLTAPVVALVLSYLLLGTVPTPVQLAGGALMLLGVSVPVLVPVSAMRR